MKDLLFLLFISAGLMVGFLFLAWFKDSLNLPEFLLKPYSNTVPTSLQITINPADAKITIDDNPYNPNNSPLPGDYVVRATHDGFLAVEEVIRIHPDQKNKINLHLIPIVTTQAITEDASSPGWDFEGNLLYVNPYENIIYKWVNNVSLEVAKIPGDLYQLNYLPSGHEAIALSSQGEYEGNKLFQVSLIDGKLLELSVAGFNGLGEDGKTIWGINNIASDFQQKPIWRLTPNRSPKYFSFENAEWANSGRKILVDPTGKWLAIEGPKGVAVWEIISGKLTAFFENAFSPVWIETTQTCLAYLLEDETVNFAQSNLNWSTFAILSSIQAPIAKLPGKSEIVFSRYNSSVGGTSFWAIDVKSMGVRLLSEAKVESGKAKQLSVSSDGKKLAFVNQNNILYVVILEQQQ